MRDSFKIFLFFEVIIGFMPLLIFWFVGVVFTPFFIGDLFVKPIEYIFRLLLVICGGVGLAGVLELVVKLISPTSNSISPIRVKLFLAIGIFAVLFILLVTKSYNEALLAIILIMPIFVTVHLIYLGRKYLFQINIQNNSE